MPFRPFRPVLGAVVALPLLAAVLPSTAAAPSSSGTLPEVADFDPGSVDLADFSGREQSIAAYLDLLPDVANSVVDDDSSLRGFIDCDCWRVGVDAPTNARVQENALTMAYFYSVDRPWNPYYGDPALRGRMEESLRYWLTLQSPAGAFPELPNDRESRPGTAFSLDFLGRSLLDVLDLGPGIDPALRTEVETALERAAWWFLTDETQVWSPFGELFANQLAAGMTAISGLLERYDDPELTAAFRDRVDDLAARVQSPAGHYYEQSVGHRYSVQVMSKDLAHWADDATWPVIRGMQERYVDWLQYQLLPEPHGTFLVNTALDSRHSRWNQEATIDLGANNSWSGELPLAGAFGSSAEAVEARRSAWREGGWDASVAPVVEDRRTRVDPVLIRDVLAEEHYPSAAEKADATDRLRPRAEDGFTAWSESPLIDQQFLYAQRDGLLAGLAWGPQPNFPPGRPVEAGNWDLPRFGRQYLWHRATGMIVQSHNAPRAGGPAAVGLDDELVWSTIDPAAGLVDAYLDHGVTFAQDGAPVEHPADRPSGAVSATAKALDGSGPATTTTMADDGLSVAVDAAGLGPDAFERIPLALRDGDRLQWLDGDDVAPGEASAAEATGLLIGRGAYAVEITWTSARAASFRPTSVDFPETPALGTNPDVVGALHVLDVPVGTGLEYAVRVVADACIGSDESPVVVIGDQDSGVANRDRGDGCTFLDLLAPGDPWPSHADFLRHVTAVLRDLTGAGVLTEREAAAVQRAAARSGIGTDRVRVSLASADVVAGESLTVRVDGERIASGRIDGLCLDGTAAVPAGGGTLTLPIPSTTLPGPCELSIATTLSDGGSEADTAAARVVPAADGTVFRDDFAAGAAAWAPASGRWAVADGGYVQSDRAASGFHSTIRGLEIGDGWIETGLDILDDGGDPTNWAGVQFRAAAPGDAYTTSGYLAFVRRNGEAFVHLAGTGVIARAPATGTAPSTLRVEFTGPDISVVVDGERRLTVSDDTYASGSMGVVTGRTHTRFDDVGIGWR